MHRNDYVSQVELLLDCLPVLKDQEYFAIKGGTAINFFIRELPRLSIDIDLTFIDGELGRINAINKIEEGLRTLTQRIKNRDRHNEVVDVRTKEGFLHKLIVARDGIKIKIEPNFIMRGILNPLEASKICQSIEDKFAYSVKDIPLVSTDELYAGKICAALSRQHPRDFFDIKILMENEGLTKSMCTAFVVYLACSPRPIHELLNPHMTLSRDIYENEFVNMSVMPIRFEELVETRERLINEVNNKLTEKERKFLFLIKEGKPDYTLLPYQNLDKLPALQWKVLNVQRMNKNKHKEMLGKLRDILQI